MDLQKSFITENLRRYHYSIYCAIFVRRFSQCVFINQATHGLGLEFIAGRKGLGISNWALVSKNRSLP